MSDVTIIACDIYRRSVLLDDVVSRLIAERAPVWQLAAMAERLQSLAEAAIRQAYELRSLGADDQAVVQTHETGANHHETWVRLVDAIMEAGHGSAPICDEQTEAQVTTLPAPADQSEVQRGF